MSLVTIKVVRTERIEDDGQWDHDKHTLLVKYAGRSDKLTYSTGLAYEGRVHPADFLVSIALDVQTADAGLEDFAACYGESVEDCRDDFKPIERYAAHVKRLFGDDLNDLDGWVNNEDRMKVALSAGQEVSFDLTDGAHQQQLFRM